MQRVWNKALREKRETTLLYATVILLQQYLAKPLVLKDLRQDEILF